MNYEYENNETGQNTQNTDGFVNGEYRYGRIGQDGPDNYRQDGRNAGYGPGQNGTGYRFDGYPNGNNGYSFGRTGQDAYQNTYGPYSGGPNDNPPEPKNRRRRSGAGRKVLAVFLAVIMLGMAAGGGFLAAKALSGKTPVSTVFSRGDMNSSGESKVAEEDETKLGEITAEQKENAGEWQLTTKAASDHAATSKSLDVSDVAEVSLPAIVAITNTSVQEIQNYFSMWGFDDGTPSTQEVKSAGSGIIIGKTDTDLLIVTNHHVIEGAQTLSVSFCDDSVYDATVKGSDSGVDVALVYVKIADLTEETKNNIAEIALGSSEALRIGEQVVAIGNALGQGQSVTTGIVSALDRTVSTSTAPLLQTDAAINPGNSGGALLNMSGELIGINSAKYSDTTVEGMGYAIPIDTVVPILERIQNKVQRDPVADEDASYIGISGSDVTAQISAMYGMPKGVYIANVTPDGPFEKAGIKAGSVLTHFDDESVTTMAGLKELLTYYAAGETVTVRVSVLEGNDYVSQEYQVTLGNAKDMPRDNSSGQQGGQKSGN